MYGVAIVIKKPNEESTNIKFPYIFIGGFDTLNWDLSKGDKTILSGLNKQSYEYLNEEPHGQTTIERLMTAPVDNVLMLEGEYSFEYLRNRKPINGRGIDLEKYLDPSIELKPLYGDEQKN